MIYNDFACFILELSMVCRSDVEQFDHEGLHIGLRDYIAPHLNA